MIRWKEYQAAPADPARAASTVTLRVRVRRACTDGPRLGPLHGTGTMVKEERAFEGRASAAAGPRATRRAPERERHAAGARLSRRGVLAEHDRAPKRSRDGADRRTLRPDGEVEIERAARAVEELVEAVCRAVRTRGRVDRGGTVSV